MTLKSTDELGSRPDYMQMSSPNTGNAPPGAEVVPEQEPHWDYNTPGGILARDWFLTCLLAGLRKATLKPVNYNKFSEVIQDMKENSSAFLKHLTKALLQFANLDPESQTADSYS